MLTEKRIYDLSAPYQLPGEQVEFARAIEAEVRAEAQKPVAFPTPPNGTIAHPILDDLYDRLQMQQYAMKYAMLHATPQPPAPCPKCVELDRWLEAGVYFTTAEYEVEVENLNALQAKVAELEQSYKDKDDAATQLVTAMREMAGKIKEQGAEIERLKTVPMKYRRMAFNAQLQDENKERRSKVAELEAEADIYKAQWAISCGERDALKARVAEQTESLRQSALNVGNWHRQFMKAMDKVAEQAALINKLERCIECYIVQFEAECKALDEKAALIEEQCQVVQNFQQDQTRMDALIEKCGASIELFLERVEAPYASCSCCISPPCNDCVEYGGLREALQDGKEALAAIAKQ